MAEAATTATESAPSRVGGLALAAAIVGFGFLGSRVLGILRTAIIARAFGSSPEMTAYVVAFKAPDLIFQVLAGATLGSAFIPVFARVYRREGAEPAWRLASNILNLVTAATAVACVVAFILAPWLVPLMAPGIALQGKAVFLTRLMLLSPLLFSVSGMITGILNARQRFLLPALAPMFYNLAIIAGALFLAGPFGVTGLAIGVIAGAALHLAIQVPGLVREGMHWRPTFEWHNPNVREVGRLMGPRVIGLGAAQLNFVVTIYFASKIGDQTVSNLNYAWVVATLPTALFGMALSTAVFPRLADHAAEEDMEALRDTVSRVLRIIMFLTIPAAIGLALLRFPAVTLLFQWGQFTRADTSMTAAALAFFCIGIVPQAGIEIHSRGFYAMGDTRTPVMLAVFAVATNVVLSALVWQRFEHQGLAFADSVTSALEWVLLYAFFIRRTGASPAADLSAIAIFTFCAAGMALFIAIAFLPFDVGGRFNQAIIALAGATAGVLVYGALANVLGVEEFHQAARRIRSRLPV